MVKNSLFVLIFLFNLTSFAQIIGDQPPYVLTIAELKAWTETGSTADPALISTETLAERFINTETQFNPNLTNDMGIAYLPDGMNNFANYGEEQSQFNLYNFTNWAYIDKLVWFGGTADQTVQLPSAPWTNAAHKNGVKVFGNVFFAPNQFGGSTTTMLDFLEQDSDDNFIVIPILTNMMEFYNFDGWFINEETSTNVTTAGLMYEFLRELTTAVEALGKEVMWYDAMLLSGNVGWQNRLTANNSVFVQNDEDGDSSNGFEQRVSSSIFINFFWNSSSFPNLSRTRAMEIDRSSFEVFTGVDVWPGRNQAPFQSGGNNWMSFLHEDPLTPYTSLGLFAPNCVFNNTLYTTFNTDPSDFEDFYSAERHMFAGADRNPRLEDISGFKGYANWIPAASTITELPFETNFNTGHGFTKFSEGVETSSSPWHNMNDQDILPNWQFAFSENSDLSASWDFDDAYNGGSSLKIEGTLTASEIIDLPLYKMKLPLTSESKLDIVFKDSGSQIHSLRALLTFTDAPNDIMQFFVNSEVDPDWFGRSFSLAEFAGRELATLGLRFAVSEDIPNYIINIGNLKVHNGEGLGTEENMFAQQAIRVIYPVDRNIIMLYLDRSILPRNLHYVLYSTDGKKIIGKNIKENESMHKIVTGQIPNGVYILSVKKDTSTIRNIKVLVR